MSHTHEDRIAEHQPGMCAAYGCPLHGTMSTATGGTDDWWCSLHFGKEAGALQEVTVALNQYRWLADVLTTILEIHPARGEQSNAERMAWIRKTLIAAGRQDLHWANYPESVRGWSNRVKAELEKLVNATFTKPVQRPINDSQESWTRVSLALPTWG